MNENIKPCPFCGGEAFVDQGISAYGTPGRSVVCSTCKISTAPVLEGSFSFANMTHLYTLDDAERIAVEKWNTRT